MLDDIMLFIKLVEVGSFSKLATLVNVTQPTVSRKIISLETLIGYKLFARTSNYIRLTENGELLYEKFKHQEKYMINALSEISQKTLNKYSTLRVALPAAISKSIISPYLSEFLEQNPNINLITSFVSGPVDLIHDGFDLAVNITMPKSTNNIIQLLHTFDIQLYANPKYFDEHPPIDRLEDLSQQSMVGLLGVDNVPIKIFTAKNLKSGDKVSGNIKTPRIYIDNILHAAEIASSGKMLVAGWDALLEESILAGKLVKILPEYSFSEIPCYLIRPSRECTPAQLAFTTFIIDCFKNFKLSLTAT